MTRKDKKKKNKKNIVDYLTSAGCFLDFERVVKINGEPTEYSVTRNGDVISYKFYGTDKPKVLTHMKTDNGYHAVNLLINGHEKLFYVHRLVASAFIENPDNKPEVNHKDGDKDNNKDTNLEWVTESENIQHAFDTKLASGRKGEAHHACTITEETVLKICRLLLTDRDTYSEISEMTGVSYTIIKKIKNKNRWTHLTKDFDFSNLTITKRKGRCYMKKSNNKSTNSNQSIKK